MKKQFVLFVNLLILLLGSVCVANAEEEESKVIVQFMEPKFHYEIIEKNSLEEISEQFPEKVEVVLEDDKTEWISIDWECMDDFEHTEYDYYAFQMILQDGYIISDELTMWEIPFVEVCIVNEGSIQACAKFDAHPSGTNLYDTYLGVNKDIVSWLESHENDKYYLGTRYVSVGSFWTKPIMCVRANGEYKEMGYSVAGMNCTGFVASVMKKLGGDLDKIQSWRSGNSGKFANAYNWFYTMDAKKIKSYKYSSVSKMLASGKLEKGDLIYFEPDWSKSGADCHIGFFWGDTPSENKFWHSTEDDKNAITKIKTYGGCEYVYIFKTQKRGSLQIKLTSKNNNYSLDGCVYKLYDSKGNVVRTLTTNASGTVKSNHIKVGTYTLKEVKTSEKFTANKESYTIRIKNGDVVTKTITKVPHTGTLELSILSSDPSVSDNHSECSLAGAIYELYDSEGKLLKEIVTDSNGKAQVKNLLFGTYTLKEKSSSDGFETDQTEYKITINSTKTVKKSITKRPIISHDVVTDEKVEPDCENAGLTEGSHCSSCGYVLIPQKKIPANGHKYIIASASEDVHIIGCETCDYTKEETHVFKKGMCKCGVEGICDHQWKTKVIKAAINKNGKETDYCAICEEVGDSRVIYGIQSVTLSISNYFYDGKSVRTPSVIVKDTKGTRLKKDVDFAVSYPSGRKNIGKYTVKVTFKGNYLGSKSLKFTIRPAKASIPSVKKESSSKIRVNWKKVDGATGYQISKSVSKKGTSVYKTTTSTSTQISPTVNKIYYYKVRAYKTVNGEKIYGPWSSVKYYKLKGQTTVKYKTKVSLTYRTGPGLKYKAAGYFPSNKTVYVVKGYSKKANGVTWYKVKVGTKIYYVSAKYLRKI